MFKGRSARDEPEIYIKTREQMGALRKHHVRVNLENKSALQLINHLPLDTLAP